ncbi:MAG: hypothetical protein SBU_001179 [Candidatus Syntrophoarchaeum butanivorans]|uniref:Uncharacterized protein n=1 Tax=Candidatus Syntropharchaeum butanivorans TaxID=1839936 RepID=A0A1F2P3X6_9EURY|nr:MAG: hypothetical protein SBU_001179 [Candidatus Syntrophoarchaeum butanivorans]
MGAVINNSQFTESQAGDGETGYITYGVSELQKRGELKRSAKLVEIQEAKDIYRFLSIIMDSVKGRVTGDC